MRVASQQMYCHVQCKFMVGLGPDNNHSAWLAPLRKGKLQANNYDTETQTCRQTDIVWDSCTCCIGEGGLEMDGGSMSGQAGICCLAYT